MGIQIMFRKSPIYGRLPGILRPWTQIGFWWRLVASTSCRIVGIYIFIFTLGALAGCAQFSSVLSPAASPESGRAPAQDPVASFYPVSLRSLPGWGDGRETKALRAFLLSCTRINKEPPSRMMLPGAAIAGKAHHWQSVCGMASKLGRNVAPGSARRFFENWFSAYQVTDRGNPNGFFTGYFEPLLNGSLKKHRVILCRFIKNQTIW